MATTTDALTTVPLFRDLPAAALQRLERIARTRTFQPGEDIVSEGDEGVGVYVITEGKVDVLRGGSSIASLGPGQFFGEMALLDNYRRSATVRATEPTTCLALSRWDFVAELKSNPDLCFDMLVLMSRRVRDLEQRIVD